MSSLAPPIKCEQGDEVVSDDDSSSDSSVNAVSGAAYLKEEERRKSVGDDDSSQGKGNDEATPAKLIHHRAQKHTAAVSDSAETMNVQSAVKLEHDADDTKDTPVDMVSKKLCIASQEQLKGEETDDDGRINDHQSQKEEQPKGDEDLKQQDSVAKTAAAKIPLYSLLTSDSDEDSCNEESYTEVLFRRPRSAWNLFNTAMKGKGLSRDQISVQYYNLSSRERAKLEAKAERNRKYLDDYQKKQKRRSGANQKRRAKATRSTASKASHATEEKVSPKTHRSTTATTGESNDVAWKCHQCGVLNAISSLRCTAHKCLAYKGRRSRHNTPTSTEGCELVWLENGAKLGEVHNNSDECYICFTGGSLICCDHCDKSFHLGCHIPPLQEVPFGDFKCCECRATTLKKLFHCGVCQTCLRGDSNDCPHKRYALPATVSPCAKHQTGLSTPSIHCTGRHDVQPTTVTSDINAGEQNIDASFQSAQTKDDVPDDLVSCQRELKRSREEVQKQAEEIKRLKGAIQALISSSH